MTFSQRAVEAAAEAMKQRRRDEIERGRERATYEQMAELALSAALAVDGVCLVPVEPTEEMQVAGDEALDQSEDERERETVGELIPWSHSAAIYRAMLSASEGEERR